MSIKSSNRIASGALVAFAVTGLLAGFSMSCASDSQKMELKDADKHACKGMNACQGKGGCKTDANACAGKNACKNKGGCATAAKHGCKGSNACKGQGGCKSGNNGCAGKNDCSGKGGCAVPVKH
jgi:hypothetical protein